MKSIILLCFLLLCTVGCAKRVGVEQTVRQFGLTPALNTDPDGKVRINFSIRNAASIDFKRVRNWRFQYTIAYPDGELVMVYDAEGLNGIYTLNVSVERKSENIAHVIRLLPAQGVQFSIEGENWKQMSSDASIAVQEKVIIRFRRDPAKNNGK